MRASAAFPGSFAMALAAALAVALTQACVPRTAVPPPNGRAEPALVRPAPGTAVLVSGAIQVKGLPALDRNAIAALAGEYVFLPAGSVDSTEPVRIAVWFTREAVVLPADWAEPVCRSRPMGFSLSASPVEPDGSTLWAIGAGSYRLFARMPGGLADPCRFIKVFAERFSFFYRYAERPEDASFPAVLDLVP